MRTRCIFKLCAPVASATLLFGCSQQVNENPNARSEFGAPRENLRLNVTGCLEAGTGTNQFVLTHVNPSPLATQPSDALSSVNLTIPPDSSVRLSMENDRQLSKHVGEAISVTGLLQHDGRNTIGTSGERSKSPNAPASRNDRSMAGATGEHFSNKVAQEAGPIGLHSMNNGTFPEMRVLQVQGTGKKCH